MIMRYFLCSLLTLQFFTTVAVIILLLPKTVFSFSIIPKVSHYPLLSIASTSSRSSSSNTRRSYINAIETSLSSSSSSSSSSSDVEDVILLDRTAWETELTKEDLEELVQTAELAARAAGKIITSHTGCCSEISDECEIKFSIKDIVTEYDKQAQDAIYDIVQSNYPTHRFLGEEDVAAGAAASEEALINALSNTDSPYLWICDPIDGTANFASGLAMSAVTMGVVYKGTPIIGIVYDPHSNELFSAMKGYGAYLTKKSNDGQISKEQIYVSYAVNDICDAIINAGCPADNNAFDCSMRGVIALNTKSRGIRMIACSALTTAWIACGRLTAHFGYDLSSWDLIAGALLIQEAGGLVTDLDGTSYKLETRNMLCSNGNTNVHEQILDVLTKADAVSFTRSST